MLVVHASRREGTCLENGLDALSWLRHGAPITSPWPRRNLGVIERDGISRVRPTYRILIQGLPNTMS